MLAVRRGRAKVSSGPTGARPFGVSGKRQAQQCQGGFLCMPWQQRQLTETKWLGQLVLAFDGALSDLEGALPTFSRKQLTYGPALNEYLDLILRDPTPGDEREVPVATVSKRYALIQHRDAVHWIVSAFERMKWNPAKLQMQALISDMELRRS
jgi:hypothetical protein